MSFLSHIGLSVVDKLTGNALDKLGNALKAGDVTEVVGLFKGILDGVEVKLGDVSDLFEDAIDDAKRDVRREVARVKASPCPRDARGTGSHARAVRGQADRGDGAEDRGACRGRSCKAIGCGWPGKINLLTGGRDRLRTPDLTIAQYDALMVLLDGKSYSEHIAWNGREYFRDGGFLWVMAFRDQYESGDLVKRPAEF